MWLFRQLFDTVLLLAEGIQKALHEAPDFQALEEQVVRCSQEAARRLLGMALEELDRALMERRDRSRLECVGMRRKSLLTWVGEISLQRRYYRDRQSGEGRFLLDEALGLQPRQRYSPLVREYGIELAVEMPFGGAEAWLARVTQGAVQLSRMALWEDVQAAGAAAEAEASRQRKAVFEDGQVPAGGRAAAALDIEFDELFVPARRTKGAGRERIGLKQAVAYEGKGTDARGRSYLKNRRVHVAVGEGTEVIEEALADFAHRWDWGMLQRCTVGGDGAPWIQKALEYLPQARYRLDPFHLRRALREGLGHDPEAYRRLNAALGEGKPWTDVEALLEEAIRRARGRFRHRVRQLKQYLENQWAGIVADPEARRLGAIEAQNYHVLARRMKRRGAAWSRRGANHMARLLAARANGELGRFAARPWPRRQDLMASVPRQGVLRQRPCPQELEDAAAWLRVRMPALYGPHSDRDWVKLLRQLAHGVGAA